MLFAVFLKKASAALLCEVLCGSAVINFSLQKLRRRQSEFFEGVDFFKKFFVEYVDNVEQMFYTIDKLHEEAENGRFALRSQQFLRVGRAGS